MFDRWIYSNEAADVAADASADHRGRHASELKAEEFNVARLTIILKRISAIDLDIREKDEGVPVTAENIIDLTQDFLCKL